MTTATNSGHGSRFTAEKARSVPPPSAPEPALTLGYDPVGRRVEKTTPTKVTTYSYDGADILRENVTASGNTTTSYYVHGPGIDEPLAKETGGVATYYHADGLGSIVKETDQAGSVTNTLRYDAWGNIEAGARDGFAFTGREWDPETGLYYYRARYYDPKAGRFLSEDPIGFEAGPNMYSYVGGDPVFWRDPFGLDPPGKPHRTKLAAAKGAFQYLLDTNYYPGVEHGGLIYQKFNPETKRFDYYATLPRSDYEDGTVDIDCIATRTCRPACPGLPSGATRAGEYHTHPAGGSFSPTFGAFGGTDADRLDEPSNLPGPMFLMESGTGNIFEYKANGPNPRLPIAKANLPKK